MPRKQTKRIRKEALSNEGSSISPVRTKKARMQAVVMRMTNRVR
jgi:hypothetical protein